MPFHNSVFREMLKHVPWTAFDALVETHRGDARIRSLTTRSQLIALLYGQLSGAASLREIVSGLESHAARLYHLGAGPVRRSTLADANAGRPAALFADLLALLMKQAHRGLRRTLGEAVYLIDATSVRLPPSADWARYSAHLHGAKVHVVYDPDADQPIYAGVSSASTNDITAAKAMPVEPGATYVFDLGYYDFAWWASLDKAGCRIVTRFKTNTPLAVVEERALPPGSSILSDRVGYLPTRQAGRRANPMAGPVREVRVRTETGRVLRLLSNDLAAPAQIIADLYKRRWAIELFFRWVKQTLRIRHFVGLSPNAVRIQIAVALIAFLLLRLAQKVAAPTLGPLAFARLVRTNLMHRKPLDRLLKPDPNTPQNTNQLRLAFT